MILKRLNPATNSASSYGNFYNVSGSIVLPWPLRVWTRVSSSQAPTITNNIHGCAGDMDAWHLFCVVLPICTKIQPKLQPYR